MSVAPHSPRPLSPPPPPSRYQVAAALAAERALAATKPSDALPSISSTGRNPPSRPSLRPVGRLPRSPSLANNASTTTCLWSRFLSRPPLSLRWGVARGGHRRCSAFPRTPRRSSPLFVRCRCSPYFQVILSSRAARVLSLSLTPSDSLSGREERASPLQRAIRPNQPSCRRCG